MLKFIMILTVLSVCRSEAYVANLFNSASLLLYFVYVFPCLQFKKQPPGNIIKLFFIRYGRSAQR